MNTQVISGLLFAAFLTTGLAAQELKLTTGSRPGYLTASIDGAQKGEFAILVLGMTEGRAKLPNGLVLGVEPDVIAGFAVANGYSPARIAVSIPREVREDFTCLAQAVSFNPDVAPEDHDAFGLSQVEKVEVAAAR